MTEEEVVQIVQQHVASLFPRTCSMCGTQFANLKDYLLRTRHVEDPISYDLEPGEWQALSLANCQCGTTLAITSDGMPAETVMALMQFGIEESERRGITFRQLLREIRDKIDARVLNNS
jgi:hypothetical protein